MSATDSGPWFERDPARRAWELDEFARQGLPVEVSEDAERQLVVRTEVVFRSELVGVRVVYSHGHPYFPPTVYGDARLLDRHQDPVTLNYCLLEDPLNDWDASRSAGQLVGKNLRRLLADTAAGPAAIAAGEADQAEPLSSQFQYTPARVVLIPEPFLEFEPAERSGKLRLAIADDGRLRVLTEVSGVGTADRELVERLIADPSHIEGRWVALDDVQPERLPARALVAAVDALDDTIARRIARRLKEKQGLPSVMLPLGITFIEQGPTRKQRRRTWVFAELRQARGEALGVARFVRAQALSKAERHRRIPELVGLDRARAVVVGAGSLGAPVALELAKAGIGVLDLVDCDIYDINNTVRHIVDATDAGLEKTELVAARCRALNPFTEVRVHQTLLGHELDETDLLEDLMTSADVIVDTTGAHSLARMLSDRCRAAGTPLVVAGLTAASYGGEIFVINDGPCFDCFVGAQHEHLIATPDVGPRSAVTPIGCRHPAFAGAGFEASELAAITARTAIRATGLTGYPVLEANWIVINFRGHPHYQEGTAAIGEDCRAHAKRDVAA